MRTGSARASKPPKSPRCCTERGLGGDSVDLDAPARSVPPRPLAARVERAQPGAALGAQVAAMRMRPTERQAISRTGVMLAFAFPDRVASNRGNGSFVLANGRGATVDQTSALARAPYIAVGRADRHGGAGPHPAGGADHAGRDRTALRRPDRKRARRSRSIAARWRLRGRRKRTLRAITLSEAPMALSPSAETAKHLRRGLDRRRPRQTAVVEIAQAMARPRDVPAQGRRRELARSVRCRARCDSDELAGARALRQDLAEGSFGRRSVGRADGAAAVGIARAAGARGADPFRGADRHAAARSTTRPSRARPSRSACRNCSGSTPIPRSPGARCRWCWNCCRRRTGRCR